MMATWAPLQEAPDFSLVLGGPTFQMLRRSHLSGDALELLHRRIVAIVLVAWMPLLLFSLVGNYFLAGTAKLPFLHDIEAHVRLLVALPALITAELMVHSRLRPVVNAFLARRIVRHQDQPRFLAAIDSATRLRNSVTLELGLAVLVIAVGQWLWRSQIALGISTWYAIPQAAGMHLTAAGYWYGFVSIPIFQFVLLRWYLRLFIWFRFLWQISKLDLHLLPTHPDRAGGLAFLGKSAYAFSPIMFAQGSLLAGVLASRVLYEGASLLSFKIEIIGFIGLFLVLMFATLTMFSPQMARAKRKGLAEYGLLANRYVDRFEQKWVVENASEADELLGTGDIQSLADLGNSYSVVKEMRPLPFGLEDIGRLAAASAIPLLPLGLTVLSLDELVMKIVKIVL
jgi:hypothetical protein